MDTNLETLSSTSCVLSAYFPNSKSESSSCGTVIDPSRGLVISHGSILTEYCIENKLLSTKVKDGNVLLPKDFPGSHFTLLLSNTLLPVEELSKLGKQGALVTLGTSSSSSGTEAEDHDKNSSSSFTQVKCQLLGAFRNNEFHKTMDKMMPKTAWTFNDATSDNGVSNANASNNTNDNYHRYDNNGNDELSNATFDLLGYFILCKFIYSDSGIPKGSKFKTHSPLNNRRGRCFIGETAEIIATPFASLCPAVFFNGYSRGVISNVSGVNDCWIVTDSRCIPGCEGGPLYTKRKPTDSDSFLTGIITSPLCWKNNEWVGFSVACGIDSILMSMAQLGELLPSASSKYMTPTRKQMSPFVKDLVKAQAMTVLVQCGKTWGTGVIINRDKGVILTCSHVIKGAGHNSVTVTPSRSKAQYKGYVVYRQEPVRTAYDLAIIKCPQATKHIPKGWCASVAQACVGEDIMLSGHAVFSTDRHLEPSICQGVVSKVIRSQGKPVMVQTTCAVHAGASGGPLLTPDCRLVGIVVCNTRDSLNNTSFPHVNLCIPISTVWPAIHNYLLTGDKEGLSQLQVQDVELNKLWALGTQASHDTGAVPQRSKL